jgi:hypothetical protein
MLQTYLPAGPLGQLSNASFFFAAVFGDVLLIRLFLSLAYVFLFAQAFLGQPRWPSVSYTGGVFLDAVIWAALSGTLHILALIRLLADERPIKFKTEEEEQLWRFFYRRSGMGRLEMQQALQYGRWRRIHAGEVILDPLAACSRLCLMIEGIGDFTATSRSTIESGFFNTNGGGGRLPSVSSKLFSGSFFDMRLLNSFGLYIGMEGLGSREKWFAAVAKTECLIYEWSIDELNKMATQCSPALSHAWRNLIATQLGIAFAWREMQSLPPIAATGQSESPAILLGARSRDFTDPLRGYEQQGRRWWDGKGLVKWLYRSIHPLMPPGVRHNDLPVHGILARNRIVALKESQLRVAAVKLGSAAAAKDQKGGSKRQVDAYTVAEEDEQATLRTLRQLESLRVLENTDVIGLAKEMSVRRGRRGRGGVGGGGDNNSGSIRSDPGPELPPASP